MDIEKHTPVFTGATARWLAWTLCGWTLIGAQSRLPELVTPQYHSGSVKALQVSRDGKWFVTAGSDRTVRVWSLPMMGHLRSFAITGSEIRSLADRKSVV